MTTVRTSHRLIHAARAHAALDAALAGDRGTHGRYPDPERLAKLAEDVLIKVGIAPADRVGIKVVPELPQIGPKRYRDPLKTAYTLTRRPTGWELSRAHRTSATRSQSMTLPEGLTDVATRRVIKAAGFWVHEVPARPADDEVAA